MQTPGRGFFRDEVVVDDDDVDACFGDAVVVARAAVAGHQKVGALSETTVEPLVAQAVTPVGIGRRSVVRHLSTEGGDYLAENYGRSGAVDVVVSEHHDALPSSDRPCDAFGRQGTVGHRFGRAQAAEASPRGTVELPRYRGSPDARALGLP